MSKRGSHDIYFHVRVSSYGFLRICPVVRWLVLVSRVRSALDASAGTPSLNLSPLAPSPFLDKLSASSLIRTLTPILIMPSSLMKLVKERDGLSV